MNRRQLLLASATGLVAPAAAIARPCPVSSLSVQGGSTAYNACTPPGSASAEADWLLRSGQDATRPQPGVVWFHDFRSDAEVNAFRWTGGVGNDPQGTGNVRRLTSDGVTGACMEILRAAGTQDPSMWWRPLSPFVGSGNGRGVNDPGANGAITPLAYAATQRGGQIQYFGRRGYYGHASYHTGNEFDGTEYYLQMRIKMDPRRSTNGNIQGGKLMYQTITDYSLTGQEIVTYSGAFMNPGSVGAKNMFRMYGLGSFSPLEDGDSLRRPGIQVGSALANYNASPPQYCQMGDDGIAGGSLDTCWAWSGGWDTILYHLVPGRDGVKESRIEVYAAHPGETSYTRIWDEVFTNLYDGTPPKGYNAIILAGYQNGLANSEFWHRYCQLIFSRNFIPCPQA